MMKKFLIVLPLLGLAACQAAEPPVTEGAATRDAMNKATVTYNDCLMSAINTVEIKDKLPPALADEAFATCAKQREALSAEVLKFRRIGYPNEAEDRSERTARYSVTDLEAQIRERLLAIAAKRRLGKESGA